MTTDFRSIPASELRPMVGGLSPWLSAVFAHKVLKSKPSIAYAIETRRLVNRDAENVPKRIMKQFAELRSQLELLNFGTSFYATVPALGPISKAVMAMSRPDGQIHCLVSHVVSRIGGEVHDETCLSFTTWISKEKSIVTMSASKLPRPCSGVDRLILNTSDPEVILKKHRDRIRNQKCLPIPAEDLFAHVEIEQDRQTEELLRRGVIRPATQAEVTRIRTEMKV